MSVDIRIMASPRRYQNVSKLLDDLNLPEQAVTLDDRPNGGDAMYTARKAWSHPFTKDITHRCVIQDDVEVCENFIDIIKQIALVQPCSVISLINFITPRHYPSKNGTPYYQTTSLSGVAIMAPIDIIKPFFEWCDKNQDHMFRQHDDLMITEYCRTHYINMLTVYPNIVQHLDGESLLPTKHSFPRVSLSYDRHATANWTNRSITT